DDKAKTYGAAANPALTVTYSGFVNGDTAASLTTLPTVSTAATASSHAGTYPITASSAVDADYTISYVAGTLTVNAAALTITADDHTKTYGTTNPVLSVTYSGFVNGDTEATLTTPATATTTATAKSHAGAYSITLSGAVGADYTIVFVPGTLTVTPAPLAIAADDQARTY